MCPSKRPLILLQTTVPSGSPEAPKLKDPRFPLPTPKYWFLPKAGFRLQLGFMFPLQGQEENRAPDWGQFRSRAYPQPITHGWALALADRFWPIRAQHRVTPGKLQGPPASTLCLSRDPCLSSFSGFPRDPSFPKRHSCNGRLLIFKEEGVL